VPFSLLFFLSWVPDDRFFLPFFLFLARVLQKNLLSSPALGPASPFSPALACLTSIYLLPALRKTKQMKAAQCRTEPIPRSFFSRKTASRARVNLAAISPTRRSVSSWDKLVTLELQSHSLYLLPSGFITSIRRCFFSFLFFFFPFLFLSIQCAVHHRACLTLCAHSNVEVVHSASNLRLCLRFLAKCLIYASLQRCQREWLCSKDVSAELLVLLLRSTSKVSTGSLLAHDKIENQSVDIRGAIRMPASGACLF